MICQQCQHEQKDSNSYCEKCGTYLKAYTTQPTQPQQDQQDQKQNQQQEQVQKQNGNINQNSTPTSDNSFYTPPQAQSGQNPNVPPPPPGYYSPQSNMGGGPSLTDYQDPKYVSDVKSANNLALASLIVSIASFVCCGGSISIVSLIMGIIAYRKQNILRQPTGQALGAIILSIIGMVIGIIVSVFYIFILIESINSTLYFVKIL